MGCGASKNETAEGVERFVNKKLTLKSAHGTYIRATQGDDVPNQAAAQAEWEEWFIESPDAGKFRLKSLAHGTYLRAVEGGAFAMTAEAGDDATFALEDVGSDAIRVKTHHNTYVKAAEGGEAAALEQVAEAEDAAAKWTVVVLEEEKKDKEAPAPAEEEKKEEEKPAEEEKKDEEAGAAPVAAAAAAPAADDEEPKKESTRSKIDWAAINAKLPAGRSKDERKQRKKLFRQFDPNGNGYLSLSEIDKGCRDVLELDEIFDSKPVIMRAYQAAKGVAQKKGRGSSRGEDFVEKSEFRLLMLYLRQYFEVWQMFDEVDSGDDQRVNLEEFKTAIAKIDSWGLKVDDAEAEFNSIDTNGGGQILFNEFAHWALTKKLDLEEDESDGSGSGSD